MKVHVAHIVSFGDIIGKDTAKGKLLQDGLGDGQIDGLGIMSRVAVLFVGIADDLLHIPHRQTKMAVLLVSKRHSPLKQLKVDHLANDGRIDGHEIGSIDSIFDSFCDLLRNLRGQTCLFDERIADLGAIPCVYLLARGR